MFAAWLQPGPERLEALRGLLSADELEKADRYAFPELKIRSAAARGQLREILGAALGVPAGSLRFQYGENGKPSLLGAPGSSPPLHFNVSHSADVALISIADREHGVDVEVHRDRSYEDVARRFFAAAEVDRLFALPAGDRKAAFFDTWTAKEAFVKATGVGITVPLADFEARWHAAGESRSSSIRERTGSDGHIEVLRGPASGRPFWLRSLEVGEGVSAAIVAEGERLLVSTALWPPAG